MLRRFTSYRIISSTLQRPFSVSSLELLNHTVQDEHVRDLPKRRPPRSEKSMSDLVHFKNFKRSRHLSSTAVTSKKATKVLSEKEWDEALLKHARRKSTPLCLNEIIYLKRGTSNDDLLLKASIFLHHELKIRLAKRAVELANLPYGSSSLAAIQEVRSWYVSSFKDLYNFPQPKNILMERRFTGLVKEIYERHSGTLWTMARGFYQLKQQAKSPDNFWLGGDYAHLQSFLDEFFMSRIGIRVLIGQHVALHEHIDGWTGLVCMKTSPHEIAKAAANSATKACIQRYGMAPEINIEASDLYFPYIPAHLHHILFEVLKNSMKATIETNEHHTESFPITISFEKETNGTLHIFVRDQGGGIPEKDLPKIWSFMFTTASESDSVELFEVLENKGRDFMYEGGMPIAGLGYGLPISRLFAKYLGGDIQIRNTPGGTEAKIVIKSLIDSNEPV